MTETAAWTCPSCQQTITTPFCARCGENPVEPRDLTVRGLAEKLVHAMTSVDARVVRTAWSLLRDPGRLTLSWAAGQRRTWVAPFQLFLLANVLFFALQSLTGINVFSSPLDSHLHHQDWSELAQQLVAQRLQTLGTTLAAFAPLFDHAVVLHAKSLIVLMPLPFALLLPLVFVRQKRPLMVHVVFALHLYTFLLLLFSVALLLAKASGSVGFGGLDTAWLDNTLTLMILAACVAWLHPAIGSVYGGGAVARTVEAAILALAVGAIALAFRFSMFVVTLYAP